MDGRRVDLTRLEFDVLDYLHQRRGKVVDRSDLLRDVWGYSHVGSNVIDTVVRSLRKKLGERASMIETIRGLGYRLRAEDTQTDQPQTRALDGGDGRRNARSSSHPNPGGMHEHHS